MHQSDVVRELQKADNVLGMVERYLTAHNESMAALHLSERVVPSPLTAAVMQSRLDLQRSLAALASEETSSSQTDYQTPEWRARMDADRDAYLAKLTARAKAYGERLGPK